MNNISGKGSSNESREIIPQTFNPYRYGVIQPIKMVFDNDSIYIKITTSLRHCACGRKTPYQVLREHKWLNYRVCFVCMPLEVRSFLMSIFNQS